MPSYNSLGSPSLRKMDNARPGHGGGRRFSLGYIIGDPFALATISIAIVSGSQCVTDVARVLLTTALP